MERILVTGGAGFVGSHLCKRLLRSDAHVVALDNLSTGNVGNLGQDIKNPRLDLIVGDIHSRKTLQRVLRKCDLVYHLAANSDVRNGIHDTKVDFEQNLVATKVILECMKESETCRRLVFASTSTVYGEPSQIPTPETYGPLKPISLYGASKLGCEAMISAYGHLFDIESTIFRLANVIGPQSSHGVVYDVTKQMSKRSNSVEILGNGKQRKSYLYIDDCIEALFMAYKWHEHQTETFNLGSNDSIQVNDIVRIINGTMG